MLGFFQVKINRLLYCNKIRIAGTKTEQSWMKKTAL